ncbi:MAG TPA: large-conductance mechanosensitive channel protein MscL [Spirillospora sp.]|nr:large-conductance mechanosensitive channel protein MscL [Spirillospora sp.]
MLREFREFIMRGNVLDLAVGIIIGAAFTSVVNSLVNDLIMPVIGFITAGIDFSSIVITLREAQGDTPAVTINIGLFINSIIIFLITGFAVFLIIKAFNEANRRLQRQKVQEEAAAPAEPSVDEKLLATLEKLDTTLADLSRKVS